MITSFILRMRISKKQFNHLQIRLVSNRDIDNDL